MRGDIFISFEKVCATADHGYAPQLFEKPFGCLHPPAAKNKTKQFARSGIHHYPDPAFKFFLIDKAIKFIDFNEGAGFGLGLDHQQLLSGLKEPTQFLAKGILSE